MKKLTSYSKRVKYTYVKTTLATLFVSLFFLKGYAAFEKTGENYFHVFLNGNEIGTVGEASCRRFRIQCMHNWNQRPAKLHYQMYSS